MSLKTEIEISHYLHRIQYAGSLEPTEATLAGLQLAHLYTVPFENLDIHAGTPILLDVDAIYRKIVGRKRGGFCYELNGLFATLLQQLGFEVTLLSASDFDRDGGHAPEFDHLILMVSCPAGPEKRWLADVGWGETFRRPLLLDVAGEQAQQQGVYRLDQEGELRFLWQKEHGGPWEPQYRFTLRPRRFEEFAGMCHYHQTSPDSHFTRKRVCSLASPEGRITLDDFRFIETSRGERRERPVSQEAHRRLLLERFGVEM